MERQIASTGRFGFKTRPIETIALPLSPEPTNEGTAITTGLGDHRTNAQKIAGWLLNNRYLILAVLLLVIFFKAKK